MCVCVLPEHRVELNENFPADVKLTHHAQCSPSPKNCSYRSVGPADGYRNLDGRIVAFSRLRQEPVHNEAFGFDQRMIATCIGHGITDVTHENTPKSEREGNPGARCRLREWRSRPYLSSGRVSARSVKACAMLATWALAPLGIGSHASRPRAPPVIAK